MVANDTPFKVGNKICVVRERHGWHDGRLKAVITGVYRRTTGTHYYSAITEDSVSIEIDHTRDAYIARF